MSTESDVFVLAAKANAAQQLAKLETFSEPLTEKQTRMMLLLLASAYADGMMAGVKELARPQ